MSAMTPARTHEPAPPRRPSARSVPSAMATSRPPSPAASTWPPAEPAGSPTHFPPTSEGVAEQAGPEHQAARRLNAGDRPSVHAPEGYKGPTMGTCVRVNPGA